MTTYTFSAERQLIFYINVGGQLRLVRFGERNAFGGSVFSTTRALSAEAIRKTALFKRGIIKEVTSLPQPAPAVKDPSASASPAVKGAVKQTAAPKKETKTAADETKAELLKAKNYTQARSLLAKKLGINYRDIKSPDQLNQLANDAGVVVEY